MLICFYYITLLNVLINKFSIGYSGEKVPGTLVVLNSEKKKMAYAILRWKFTRSTDKPHVI